MLKGNQSKQRSRKTEEMEGEIEGKGNLPFAESAERAQRLEDQRFPSPKSESLQVKLANSHKKSLHDMILGGWLLAPTDLEKRMTKSEKKFH